MLYAGIFCGMGELYLIEAPPVAYDSMCKDKKVGGLGIRDSEKWNLTAIGRLVWDVASKADKLWVKLVNHVYMKEQDWWCYQPRNNTSCTWRKICKVRDTFTAGYSDDQWMNSKLDTQVING